MTDPTSPLSLAADFEPATRQQWRDLVVGVLARSGVVDRDPEEALATARFDGMDVRPLYTAADRSTAADTGLPGSYPFVRGATRAGAGTAGWDVRQFHGDPDPVRTNEAILTDLENGATSLWLAVGRGGLPIDGLATALRGVYLDLAPIVLQAGPDTERALRGLLALAEARGVATADLRGSAGADPIADRCRTGQGGDLAGLPGLLDLVPDGMRAITVDATVYHDAGASPAQQLGIATAVGAAYLRALTDAGVSLDRALATMEFRFALTDEQFGGIALLRAARRVWARVAELCGTTGPEAAQRQHAVSSRAMLTRRDPWVNLLRATIACFSAAAGGAESITVLPFDDALGLPVDFSRRLARNTQSILHDEASLARVIDPAGGSYYVESLTAQLADQAWTVFTGIERDGGIAAVLDDGSLAAALADTAARRRADVAHRRDAITGVSEFANLAETALDREPAASPNGGVLPVIRYAEEFEALRDRSDTHAAETGSPPTVFLAALGPVAAHSARLAFATGLFAAGGVHAVAGTGTIEEIVHAWRASPSVLVCLCSSDRVYAEQATPAARALLEAGAVAVYLAGPAADRAEADQAAGITEHLVAGGDAVALLRSALTVLGVR